MYLVGDIIVLVIITCTCYIFCIKRSPVIDKRVAFTMNDAAVPSKVRKTGDDVVSGK